MRWSKEEDALLTLVYDRTGFVKTTKFFHWRSSMAIRLRVKFLGLSDLKYSNIRLKRAFSVWLSYQDIWESFEEFLTDLSLPANGKSVLNLETRKWEDPE